MANISHLPSSDETPVQLAGGFYEEDQRTFQRFGVGIELLAANAVRVTDEQARAEYGYRSPGDNSGILFIYRDWKSNRRVTSRLRRDHPEIIDGKPSRKYLSPYGDRRHFFIPAGTRELVEDRSVPVLLVESEKAALSSLSVLSWERRRVLPVAMGGC
jgi:hypothetical protein